MSYFTSILLIVGGKQAERKREDDGKRQRKLYEGYCLVHNRHTMLVIGVEEGQEEEGGGLGWVVTVFNTGDGLPAGVACPWGALFQQAARQQNHHQKIPCTPWFLASACGLSGCASGCLYANIVSTLIHARCCMCM